MMISSWEMYFIVGCVVPYKIATFQGNNSYVLDDIEGGLVSGSPVNGRILKHYFL